MPDSLDKLPEAFVSSTEISLLVSQAVKKGQLRKLGSRLYTKNLDDAPEKIVRRNWMYLLKDYYPDALIADRTALENAPAQDGSVFIVSSKKRAADLPGITFKPRKGHPPLESDLSFIGGLRLSSEPRAWLENMRPSRARQGSIARTLTKAEMEKRMDTLIRQRGETGANKLRDEARKIAGELDMPEEFKKLDELIGSLLGTRDAKLETPQGKARKSGHPYDPERIEVFMTLFEALKATAPVTRLAGNMAAEARANLSFFEAYFSNFIEGTEFAVEEAVDIVFNGVIPAERPEDAHDVLGTFRVVSNYSDMARLPEDAPDFLDLLKHRHAVFMEQRPGKRPGQFKLKPNRWGTTDFVAPELVAGTLEQGFEIYRALDAPLHRAIYMMFLVSEVHPFSDGNGRAARIMMNAELVAANEQKIIIPIIYRNNYVAALKALTHNRQPEPLIRALDFAQKYTVAIDWQDFTTARQKLEETNAFLNPNEAESQGIRLKLP